MTAPENRLKRLEAIRGLAMGQSYAQALGAIAEFLSELPDDLEGIRLKANILELKVFDETEYVSEKLLRSKEYLEARRCYEDILKTDPDNTLALIDLGEHFKNLDAHDKARAYYDRARSVLRRKEFRLNWRDEVNEAFERYIDLCEQLGRSDDKSRLQDERKSLLSGLG